MENTKIDDFTRYSFLAGIKYSPDGKWACFAVHKGDVEDNKYLSNLYLYNVENSSYMQLTSSDKEGSFIWSSDSKSILFPGLRDERDNEKKKKGEEFTQYYKISINGGEALKDFRIAKDVTSIKQVDENTYLFTASYDSSKPDLEKLDEKKKAEELKKLDEEKDYEIFDEIPFWANGEGFINKKRNRLYIYHKDNNSFDAITDEYTSVDGFNLSSDKKKAVFICYTYKDKMPMYNKIYILDIKSKKVEEVPQEESFGYSFVDFITGDSLIAAGSNMKKYGINENHKFYIISIKTGKKKCISSDKDFSLWDSVGSDCRYGSSQTMKKDDKYVYFITTEMDSSYINRIDENGNIEKVTKASGSVDGFDVISGKVLEISMRDGKLEELYTLDGDTETQKTHFNDWVFKERKIASLERYDVETAPGVVIEGWVMRPVDFKEGKKYPAILDIHGGPKTVYGEPFFHEMQYLASQGYAVFFCNPRGGDGRGDEFSDIRGKYGTIDYEDLMKFTDAVIKKFDFIDKDRLGVTGGSYGGFMTNWIIGHTNRFKAAVSQRSISNWISKFNTTDIGYFFVDDQNAGATPWTDYEKLWQHSPLKYADRVKTPTLFIHSNEDYRCWMAEGIQMFTALKYHGVEARFCLVRGENHELSRSGKPKHRIKRLTEMTNWFDAHLK